MSLTRRYDFGLSLIRDAGELALGYFNNRDQPFDPEQGSAGHGQRG